MRKEKLEEIKRYIDEFKTISISKKDTESSFLTIETYDCHLNNGYKIKREKILKNGQDGSAAIILPVTIENEIILAIEPRVFTKETVDVGLPAGYIEKDELPIDAAKRELLEETGYLAEELISLGSFYQDQGCSAAYNHYFLAKKCVKIKEQKLDQSEFIKYVKVKYDDLIWLIENGYIQGLNSIYTIEKSKSILKLRK